LGKKENSLGFSFQSGKKRFAGKKSSPVIVARKMKFMFCVFFLLNFLCVMSFQKFFSPSFLRRVPTGGLSSRFQLKSLQSLKQNMGKLSYFKEYLVSHVKHKENKEFMTLVNTFMGSKPDISLVFSNDSRLLSSNDPVLFHYLKQRELIADSCVLERLYLGLRLQSNIETISSWNKTLRRRKLVKVPAETVYSRSYAQQLLPLIQRISYLSKSLQSSLVSSSSSSLVKSDSTVVTYLDYAIQALLIDHIHCLFPNDLFLVEEDYHELQALLASSNETSKEFLNQILSFVNMVSSVESDNQTEKSSWNQEKLLSVFEIASKQRLNSNLPSLENAKRRLWIIDPIDGTKGFISGKQYCHALSVVELSLSPASVPTSDTKDTPILEGKPLFSCISCPNLNIDKVFLSPNLRSIFTSSSKSIIDHHLASLLKPGDSIEVSNDGSGTHLSFPAMNDGLLVYAEENEGAHCRSFSMSIDSGYPLYLEDDYGISVPSSTKRKTWVICGPVEKKHHNSTMTREIFQQIEKPSSFSSALSTSATSSSDDVDSTLSNPLLGDRILSLPVHSQVKYVLVLLGLADGYLKISSQPDYQEKIYDHYPGYHLLKELFYNRNEKFLTNLYGDPLQFNYQTGYVENTIPSDESSFSSSLSKHPKGSPLNGVLASFNPLLHDLIISQLSRKDCLL
jgi:3'-phosphoadenosine 5'-phosphosulfate (PAPS) 3'-phosphatase